MNRTCLAVAVAGALAVPLGVQAEVIVYGVAHVSVDSLDNDGAGLDAQGRPVEGQDGAFVSSNESRIGFRGSESLGGGLDVIWQIESEVNLDEGGNGEDDDGLASRNSFVGLRGGWGTVLAGRHDTPMKRLANNIDLFDEQIGDSSNILRNRRTGADGDPVLFGFDERPSNAVAYVSPRFAGMQGMVLYSIAREDDAADGRDEGDLVSASLAYDNGPVWVGAAYETHDKELTGDNERETGWRLGASYDMGRLKVTGLYQQLKDLGGVSGADRDAWGLGGALAFGANVLKAQWYRADDLDTVSDSGADMWAVGVDHNFSRRTTAYVAYAKADNDAAADFSIAASEHGADLTSAAGSDPSGFSLGLIHRF